MENQNQNEVEDNRDILREWLKPHGILFLVVLFGAPGVNQYVKLAFFLSSLLSFAFTTDRIGAPIKQKIMLLLQSLVTGLLAFNAYNRYYPTEGIQPTNLDLILVTGVWLRGEMLNYQMGVPPYGAQ